MTDNKVTCPYCKTEIEPFPFGFGYVWICKKCGRVIKSESVSVEGKRGDNGAENIEITL
jgi:ribosomal protein L37AE/L43A